MQVCKRINSEALYQVVRSYVCFCKYASKSAPVLSVAWWSRESVCVCESCCTHFSAHECMCVCVIHWASARSPSLLAPVLRLLFSTGGLILALSSLSPLSCWSPAAIALSWTPPWPPWVQLRTPSLSLEGKLEACPETSNTKISWYHMQISISTFILPGKSFYTMF